MDVEDDLVAQEGEVVVLLEEHDLNHHLVYVPANYHIFSKQIFLGHQSTIYVAFYYRVEDLDAYPLEEADQLLPHCREVDLNGHFVSPRCGS